MDLTKLFEMQKVLDARIEKEHPREDGEDRLAKKILALQVELGELANELPRTFKFWSNKKNDYKKALVEYVDCLHFILSIGLEKNVVELDINQGHVLENTHPNLETQFLWLSRTLTDLYMDEYKMFNHVRMFFLEFLALGEMLGFTFEQIESAYIQKNEVNHDRQNTGY
ncbi:MAG TPA: dUTP diphosphatase [Paenisporosarcina sp.]|nr:dUTP diphosphatase [Paenisporosarcina sp.]